VVFTVYAWRDCAGYLEGDEGMNDLRKAAEMALEALDCLPWQASPIAKEATQALRQALAQPEQEPVAWAHIENKEIIEFETDKEECEKCEYCVPLYTAPPKREWVGLTDEEFEQVVDGLEDLRDCWIQIEAKLKEKNFE
jgi:hypothetical protein